MERREDDKIQSNNYCICTMCGSWKKSEVILSLILQTRARIVFCFLRFIHSIQIHFFFQFFFCLMERPRKWRRKIGSIIVYERQANNVKISSADRPFDVFRFHENSREKKKRFFTKKSYYLHLIMLIKWKARDSSVIRAESKMSTKLSHSLFYTISIDEFRGR